MLDARKQYVITLTSTDKLAARFSTHAHLSEGLKDPAEPSGLDPSYYDFSS